MNTPTESPAIAESKQPGWHDPLRPYVCEVVALGIRERGATAQQARKKCERAVATLAGKHPTQK